jgi:hypothetical protein
MRASIPAWLGLAATALLAPPAFAGEGYWTFDQVPAAKIKAALGVDIDKTWLTRVQAAAVRLSVGCSASMVSAEGLLLTNNHCVSDCAQAVSPKGADYVKDGFLAADRPGELACPGLDAEVLVGVSDATARMQAAGAGLFGGALVKARDSAAAAAESEACGGDARFHCQMVGLFHGGRFQVYKYRRYSDVRLVFAAGDRAGSFGGDPDNFNFPRYAFDVGFLRLYEDGRPAATPQRLVWTPAPPTEGQPVFVAGNPGSTYRELTAAQVQTQATFTIPISATLNSELRGRLIAFGESSPANARDALDDLDGVENGYKIDVHLLLDLDDPAFMAAKRRAEADLRGRILARMGASFGDPWGDLERVQPRIEALYLPYRMLEGGPPDSALFNYARSLVRAAAERKKPSTGRLPGYADSQLAVLEKQVLDPAPIRPQVEQLKLEFWLSKTRELLTADDPGTKLLLGQESPEGLAARLVSGSRLGDAALRKALWDGGEAAIETSDDPMIRFVRATDPAARAARTAYEDQVTGPAGRAAEAIAKGRFALFGDTLYPDGTFTLRLAYGAIAGWSWRGKTLAPFTTFAGLYERATGASPFELDPRWLAAKNALDGATVFNLVATCDIIGGNSGSPLLDAKGEVIGTVFDGNIHSIVGDYAYDAKVNRAVAVTAAAITEALRKVYHADALAAELAGP